MRIQSKFLINHTAHEIEKISDDEALLNPPKLLQTVTMTTLHNEKYVCELPAEDSMKEQEDAEYTVSKAKGQLISVLILMSLIFQKNLKNLKDICPENLKSGLN